MSRLSRPYQFALAALILLVLVWLLVLRSHNSSQSSTPAASTSTSVSKPSTSSAARAPAASTSVYHGPAPGVEGLTRDIAKAHATVAASQQSAQQLQSNSDQASSAATPSAATPSTTSTSASTASQPASAAASKGHATRHRAKPHKAARIGGGAPSARPNRAPAKQVLAETAFSEGKVVVVLFLNPSSSVDRAVSVQLHLVANALRGRLAAFFEVANQAGSFGSITQAVQVYETPTLLIINKHGLVRTLTGLLDAFSIEQAVSEAR